MAAKTRAAIGPTSSDMRATVAPDAVSVPRTPGAGARLARAHDRARWAYRQSKSKNLAVPFHVTPGRIRHFASDDTSGPLTLVCAAAADPACDGEAILTVVEESVEDRYAEADQRVLRARLRHLMTEAEHAAQAQQDRALMLNGAGTNDALRKHARILREIAALRVRLGLEESVH